MAALVSAILRSMKCQIQDAAIGLTVAVIAVGENKKGSHEGCPFRVEIGAGEEIRTPDPRITNALLYQLSYPGEGGEV